MSYHINTSWDVGDPIWAFIQEMISHPDFDSLRVNRESKTPRWSLRLRGRRPMEAIKLEDLSKMWNEWRMKNNA